MSDLTYSTMETTPAPNNSATAGEVQRDPITDEPRLTYKNMVGGVNETEYVNPGSVSAQTFTKSEYDEAVNVAATFASPETKEWLKGSEFGKDPGFITHVLEWARSTIPRELKAFGVKSLSQDPAASARIIRELQGGFEHAILKAKTEWIREYGSIVNYQHPMDHGNRLLKKTRDQLKK